MSNVLFTVSNSFINFVQSNPALQTPINSTDTLLLWTVLHVPRESPYNFSNFNSLNTDAC